MLFKCPPNESYIKLFKNMNIISSPFDINVLFKKKIKKNKNYNSFRNKNNKYEFNNF